MLAAVAFAQFRGIQFGKAVATLLEGVAILSVAWWMTNGYIYFWPGTVGPLVQSYYAFCSAFLLVPFVLIVFAFSRGYFSQILSWKPFVLLGRISFSTYMIHQIVINVARTSGIDRIGNAPAIAITLACIYLASAMLHYLLEEPARRLIVKIARRPVKVPVILTAAPPKVSVGGNVL
jgi:peptidoglycan/LPS O-acetylase OafA/YrhL